MDGFRFKYFDFVNERDSLVVADVGWMLMANRYKLVAIFPPLGIAIVYAHSIHGSVVDR